MEYWAAFVVINIALILSMHLVQGKKIDFKNKKTYICYLLSLITLLLIYDYSPVASRLILYFFVYYIEIMYLFKTNIKQSFILGIMLVILNILAEVIYASLVISILLDGMEIASNALNVFINNLFIGIIWIILSLFVGKRDFYQKILKLFSRIEEKQIMIFSLLILIVFNFFSWIICLSSIEIFNNLSLLFIGSGLSIFCTILVVTYFKTTNSYKDITEKYNLSLENIKEYEDMIEKNRINNHEIRNQFMMLRNMSRNKKINNYIDSILDTKISDNEELLNDVLRIPSGGLRGLIYTKLLVMREQNIDFELYVDKKINVRKIHKIDSKMMIDICKIIGVFLDNSIEAVKNLKEKCITIEMFKDKNDIVISITNNFVGYLDVGNLEQSGYTSKGENHGYGLKLVSETLKVNHDLENYKELYEDNFTQNLKIKM